MRTFTLNQRGRHLTAAILLSVAFAIAACAGNPADSPVKAPGHHQDLWDEVAHLTAPSITAVFSKFSTLSNGLYGGRASDLWT